jgi:hypothetical protein
MSRKSNDAASTHASPETLLMIVNPENREAYRLGEGPTDSGPLFFTSRDALERYAAAAAIATYEVVEVPGYVLPRMRGKPHWVDGERRG